MFKILYQQKRVGGDIRELAMTASWL